MKAKELKRKEELIKKIFSITPQKDLKIFLENTLKETQNKNK